MLRKHFMMSGLEKPDYEITYYASEKVPFFGGYATKNLAMTDQLDYPVNFKVVSDTYEDGIGTWGLKFEDSNNTTYQGYIEYAEDLTGYADYGGPDYDYSGLITELSFPEGITRISGQLLSNPSSLTDVYFPNSLQTIGDDSFSNTSLTNVYLDNVDWIGRRAFTNSTIQNLYYRSEKPIGINDEAFHNCQQLQVHNLAPHCTWIRDRAFGSCKNIHSWEFPSDMEYCSSTAFVNSGIEQIVIKSDYILKSTSDTLSSLKNQLTHITIQSDDVPMNSFNNYNKLRNIYLTVKTIEPFAFYNNPELSVVELDEGLEKIGTNAFDTCPKLSNVTIPYTCTNIDSNAFANTNMQRLDILNPNAISIPADGILGSAYEDTIIGVIDVEKIRNDVNWAQYSDIIRLSQYCIGVDKNLTPAQLSQMTGKSSYTKLHVTTYNNNKLYIYQFASPVNIPYNSKFPTGVQTFIFPYQLTSVQADYLKGSSVKTVELPELITSIQPRFFNQSNITNINIPSKVKQIGQSAFEGCFYLKQLQIPKNVKTISDRAFLDSGLENIIFEEGVESLAFNALTGCRYLKRLEIPSTMVITGGPLLLHSTTSSYINEVLEYISVADNNPTYDSRNNCNALIETATNTLLLGCKNTSIPDTINIIGSYSMCCSPTSIVFPQSLSLIKENAFYHSNVQELTFPDNDITVEIDAFVSASEISKIKTSGTLENFFIRNYSGKCAPYYNHNSIPDRHIYLNDVELTDIIVPETITAIPKDIFTRCANLTSISLPNTITEIQDSFNYCYKLTSITIPDSVTTIYNAFRGCVNLNYVSIGANCSSIGQYAFKDCYFAKSNFINNSTLNAEEHQFWGATLCDLEENACLVTNNELLYIRPNHTNVVIPSSVTTISNTCTASNVSSITIPDTVTNVPIYALIHASGTLYWNVKNQTDYELRNLNSYTRFTKYNEFIFGESVQVIPNAFCNKNNIITSLEFPSNVLTIGEYAFTNCTNLQTIRFNGVQRIKTSAFLGCTNLKSIYLPASITQIDSFAFGSKPEVYYSGTKAQWNAITISHLDSNSGNNTFSIVHCSDGDI